MAPRIPVKRNLDQLLLQRQMIERATDIGPDTSSPRCASNDFGVDPDNARGEYSPEVAKVGATREHFMRLDDRIPGIKGGGTAGLQFHGVQHQSTQSRV